MNPKYLPTSGVPALRPAWGKRDALWDQDSLPSRQLRGCRLPWRLGTGHRLLAALSLLLGSSRTRNACTEKTPGDKEVLLWWAACSRPQASPVKRERMLLVPTPNPAASQTINYVCNPLFSISLSFLFSPLSSLLPVSLWHHALFRV